MKRGDFKGQGVDPVGQRGVTPLCEHRLADAFNEGGGNIIRAGGEGVEDGFVILYASKKVYRAQMKRLQPLRRTNPQFVVQQGAQRRVTEIVFLRTIAVAGDKETLLLEIGQIFSGIRNIQERSTEGGRHLSQDNSLP